MTCLRASSLTALLLPVALLALVASAGGCRYDADEAEELVEVRHLVPAKVQTEVDRVRALFEKSKPSFSGPDRRLPVPDAFNEDVDPENPAPPAFGGRVRIADRSEPKRLTYFMDSSAITSEINRYIFNGLLYREPVSLEIRPDLATHWETEDVVWLKGYNGSSLFEARSESKTPAGQDNAYLIGNIDLDSVVWRDEDGGEAESLTIYVQGEPRVLMHDEMRVRVNEDGSYRRMFDRDVVYTFHLRQGVKFHDGEPFSAEDVIFTLDLISNPFIPELTSQRAAFTSVKNWEAPDDETVRIYLDEQYFAAIELFGSGLTIFPRHVFYPDGVEFTPREFAKHFTDHPAIDAPIGTGPYAFPSPLVQERFNPKGEESGWVPGNYVHVYRTGEFWDPYRRGYLDELMWLFYSSGGEGILRAMNNGEVDFTRHFGSDEIFRKTNPIDAPRFNERYVKIFYFTPAYGFISLNSRKPYFEDKRVRQAFNMLFDRDLLNDNLSYGIAVPISGAQFYFGPAYNESVKPYSYNRKEAERLLNEAGWVDTDGDGIRDKDGIPFEIDFLLGNSKSLGETIAYIMKEDLESLGIRMELRRLEWQSLLEHIDERKFDMFSLSFITDIELDPYGSLHSSQWLNRGQNTSGFNNPEADRLILQIRREVNEERRIALHHQLQALVAEEAPEMYLYIYPQRGAYHRRIRNVILTGMRPGYFAWQWYIPASLQTEDERAFAKERWAGVEVHPLEYPSATGMQDSDAGILPGSVAPGAGIPDETAPPMGAPQ